MRKNNIRLERSLTRDSFNSSLVSYILSSLAYAIGPLVDGAVIGNCLGVDAVSAYGMAWPAILILALAGGVISGGARNLFTKLMSQGKAEEANGVFTIAQVLNFLVSALLVGVVWLFPGQIASLLGAEGSAGHMRPLIADYLIGFSLGVPFMNGAKLLSSFMVIDSDPGRNIVSVICMTVTDVIGDLLAVFVFSGSMLGIGMATAAGNLVQFIVLSFHFLRKNRILRYSFRNLTRYLGFIWEIIKNGAPSGVTRISGAAGGVILNHILASFAESAYIAAYSVQKSVISLFSCIYLGVADTVWTLSSIYYGEEDRQALNSLQKTALLAGESIIVLSGILLFLHSGLFARIYITEENPEVFALAKEAIRVFASTLPLYLLVYAFFDYLMGTKHLTAANIFGYFLECGSIAPLAWILVILMGGRGVWHALVFAMGIMAAAGVIFILFYPHGKGFREKRLLLYPGFGTESGQEISYSATTLTDIMGMSRLSGLFCRENGIDSRRAAILSLCVEEMAVNILKHGYTGKKASRVRPQIDIRFLVKENEIILRIRDNGTPFNPVEMYSMTQKDPEEPGKNLGIRLVMEMSKDVNYYNMNRTNNLIVRI